LGGVVSKKFIFSLRNFPQLLAKYICYGGY